MKLQTEGRQTERNTWLDHLGFEGPLQPGTHARSDPSGEFPTGPAGAVPRSPGGLATCRVRSFGFRSGASWSPRGFIGQCDDSRAQMAAVPFWYQPLQARLSPAALFHAGQRRLVGRPREAHDRNPRSDARGLGVVHGVVA